MLIRRKLRPTPSSLDRRQSNSDICPPEWLPNRPTGPIPTGSAGFNPGIPILPPPVSEAVSEALQGAPSSMSEGGAVSEAVRGGPSSNCEGGSSPSAVSEAVTGAPSSASEGGSSPTAVSEAVEGAPSSVFEGGAVRPRPRSSPTPDSEASDSPSSASERASSPAPARPKRRLSAASKALRSIPSPAVEPNSSKSDPDFHRRRCAICNHEDRADIEAAFLNWHPFAAIVWDYKLPSRSAVYRHAEVMNLPEQRRQNMYKALDLIIEHAGSAKTSATDVMRAIELTQRMRGENVAPLYRYEITYIGQKPAEKGEEKVNRDTSQLTPPITH
jgi:hypothetical protein